MRLTKKQALEKAIELWNWLAKTGESRKEYWPGWKNIRGGHQAILNKCFLCEYTRRTRPHDYLHDQNCQKCPLKDFWGGNKLDKLIATCEYEGALYVRWSHAETRKERKIIAKQVVDICYKVLTKEKK